jgi:transposase
VLCVDEKSQIQALERSAPVLPLLPGVPARQSHDYVRNGTTNLYAALDVASGHVIAEMKRRQRAEEFRCFLDRIDAAVPAHLDVHVVLDNSSTHKTPSIQRWLLRHPRFMLHFTPTYSSWLNLVERWFAELTTKSIKRGSHRSLRDLVASIRTRIANWNDDPKPFVWYKTATRSSTAPPHTASGSTTQDTRRAQGTSPSRCDVRSSRASYRTLRLRFRELTSRSGHSSLRSPSRASSSVASGVLPASSVDSRAPRRRRRRSSQVVASTASRMTFVTASGRVTSDRWPAVTVDICAPARLDIFSCNAGGMTLSSVPINDHAGIVRQAGEPDGSKSWLRAAGRCTAASRSAVRGSTPFAKHSSKPW